MVYDIERCKNCCSIMRECRRKNAELGGGWRCLGGEAPIPKLAAHCNLEPGGVVCVSAAFGSPTRTFRPLRGLSFFGFGATRIEHRLISGVPAGRFAVPGPIWSLIWRRSEEHTSE